MKKVLTLLVIMTIVLGTVFAAPGTGNASSEDLSSGFNATMEVTLDLSSDSDLTKYFEIGFSTAPVTAVPTEESPVTPKTTIKLEDATGADGDIRNKEDVYIYWIVKGDNVDLTLSTGAALDSSEVDATDIHWSATIGTISGEGGTASDSEARSDGSNDTASVTGIDGTSAIKVGSAPLTISTIDLLSTTGVNGNYTGKLTLSIASN